MMYRFRFIALLFSAWLVTGCGQSSTESSPPPAAQAATPPAEDAAPMVEAATNAEAADSDGFPAGWALPAVDKSDPEWKQKLAMPEVLTFDADTDYEWVLETNKGTMRFRLFHEAAPMHVSSTIYLTRLGFYDDIVFHRVIPGFMAQGGDPIGNGTGGPGYMYDGEFEAGLMHDRPGLLSMANRGPGTDGSQFFITFVPTPWLNGKHTIFGELIEGQDTLAALEERGSRSGQTSELLKIERATIEIEPRA